MRRWLSVAAIMLIGCPLVRAQWFRSSAEGNVSEYAVVIDMHVYLLPCAPHMLLFTVRVHPACVVVDVASALAVLLLFVSHSPRRLPLIWNTYKGRHIRSIFEYTLHVCFSRCNTKSKTCACVSFCTLYVRHRAPHTYAERIFVEARILA